MAHGAGMPRRLTAHLPADLASHFGRRVVRTRELEELGLSRYVISYRCRAGGPWRSLCPGIVLLHNGSPTRDDRRLGGLLHGGAGTVITGLDALELHGMDRLPRSHGPVPILVPADRRRAGYGLVTVIRTDRMPEPEPGRWPIAPLARAVLDHCRMIRDRDQVRSALAEVVQRGRCTPGQLAEELRLGAQRHTKLPRAVLAEVGDGVRSVAEAKARELVRRSGLPAPMWNPTVVDARTGEFVAVPDAWFDDVALAWELDSREWHLDPKDYEATLLRRSTLTGRGISVLAHAPSRLTLHADEVLRELRAHHREARRRPRPPVRAIATPSSRSSPYLTNGTFVT